MRHKKMPPEKPRISSVFLVFSPFSGTLPAKCGFYQKSIFYANKKMPKPVFTPEVDSDNKRTFLMADSVIDFTESALFLLPEDR